MNAPQLYKKQGRRYVPVPDTLDHWSGFMVLCAVRYCLGRYSYAPGVAMDWCRDHWHRLSDNDKHIILRDVIEWLSDRRLWDIDGAERLGDYRGQWEQFAVRRLESEPAEFAAKVVRDALCSQDRREAPEVQPFLRWLQSAT